LRRGARLLRPLEIAVQIGGFELGLGGASTSARCRATTAG
jgi:hypothetical protein